MFNASQRISELERNVEELKRKAAQNSGEAEYIEKVVYTVKQSADDVKKVSKALFLHGCVHKRATVLLQAFLGMALTWLCIRDILGELFSNSSL